jgi:4-aminobutyrate aminotransferase
MSSFLRSQFWNLGRQTLLQDRRRRFLHLTASEIEEGKKLLSPVLGHYSEVVVESAKGSWIKSTDGVDYLDFSCGIAVTNIGHCHPRVVKAIQEGAEVILHAQQNIVYHKGQLKLAKLLKEDLLPYHDQFFFANSGAEAVEASIKLARHATGKPNIIVMQGGFHGRTIGTMSLTHSNHVYRRGYQPLMSGVYVAPFPYCHHCTGKCCAGSCNASCCLEPLELLLKQQTAPRETAAVLIEPVLGEGGYVPAPATYMEGLREICTKNDILLIADEVQTGVGRTGDWMAMHQHRVKPDITVFAKGIASGLPLSGIGASAAHMAKWEKSTHGGTYGGNAIATLAACATIEAIKEEKILENCRQRSTELVAALSALKKEFPDIITDVRGLGLMIGIEFNRKKVPAGFTSKIVKTCIDNGLLILPTSVFEVIRFIPPINVTQKDLAHGLSIFTQAFKQNVQAL